LKVRTRRFVNTEIDSRVTDAYQTEPDKVGCSLLNFSLRRSTVIAGLSCLMTAHETGLLVLSRYLFDPVP